jgi:hypothetical protein
MADRGPWCGGGGVMFMLLSSGLLLQLPAKGDHFVEFSNFQTCGTSIFVHIIVFFAIAIVFLIARTFAEKHLQIKTWQAKQ